MQNNSDLVTSSHKWRRSIVAWIHSLPDQNDRHPEGVRKRKLVPATSCHNQQLASPPASLGDDDMSKMELTPKKRRRGRSTTGEFADPDATPRPGTRSIAISSGSFSGSASETSSVASGTTSAKTQLMKMRLCESGVECKALDVDAAPDAAQKLVSTMEEIGRALDILPHALRTTIIEKVKARSLDHRKWRHSFKSAEEQDGLPGRIPTFEEVENIHRKASECQEFSHEEASWNNKVHLRLLESTFEEVLGGQCDDFNAMSCTTARPHREFKPVSSSIKMVDMCVYASVDRDADLVASVMKFSSVTPTQTVNHTDFEAISTRPLLLSIETKKPGVHWDTAQLQMGIWHAAQWSFLQWAVGQKLLRQRAESGMETPETAEEQKEFKMNRLAVLSALGAIPGIIIQGHRWHLVLSTYEDGKTKLWTDLQFGTTQSCLEIYAVVAGMRQLTGWARDVYMPWFKASILD